MKSVKIPAAQCPEIRNLSVAHFAIKPLHFSGFGFGCSSTFPCGKEHVLSNLQPDTELENRHSGGCPLSQSNFVQKPFKKSLHGCRLDFPYGLRPLKVLFSRRTSTSWCWWFGRWIGFWCRFYTHHLPNLRSLFQRNERAHASPGPLDCL